MVKEKGAGETRGERLRRLRKAKGLSLEQVHQRTKIHIQILKALEEDAVAQMAPAYVKGLLKIYCALLGVDIKDFIEEETKEDQIPAPPLTKPRISISLIKKQLKIKPIIFVICLLVLAVVTFKFGKNISVHRRKSTPTRAVTQPKISSPLAPATVISKPRLGIRAKEDCWLEVKIDGRTVFKNILKKGLFEYWEAKEEIEFSLGNAGGVDVEVNGKLLPSLGRRGRVIKNITITKEGLTVPK